MSQKSYTSMADCQRVLDKGFQHCLALAEELQAGMGDRFGGQLELAYIRDEELRHILSPWLDACYEVMAQTLFYVLRILQPEGFDDGGKVNFYLLPGYHSCLLNRRVYYQGRSSRNLGVGLFGDPISASEDIQKYHDCCQARWSHHSIVNRPPEKGFLPASPYLWFAYQQPRVSDLPQDMIASLTFTKGGSLPKKEYYAEHLIFDLDRFAISPAEWGVKLAEVLNGMPYRVYPQWLFPDRRDRSLDFDPEREREFNKIRCTLISLWMHSVFLAEEPDWLDDFVEALNKQHLISMAAAISAGRTDSVARDWGDQSSGRPMFKNWTMIALHRPVAPPPTPLIGPRERVGHEGENSTVDRLSLGLAEILSSTPLGVAFISVARNWVRTIYGMLRSAEVNVLLRDRESFQRAAQATRVLSHDSHKFITESIRTVLSEAEECSPDAIAYRRHVLFTLQAQSTLAYGISSAASDPAKAQDMREQLQRSLLIPPGRLVATVYQVASEIQRLGGLDRGARVDLPEALPTIDSEVSVETYVTCLLLVGEMVRNHCRHGQKGDVAQLSVALEKGRLKIALESRAVHTPGQSFGLLHNLLETLAMGETRFERSGGTCRWIVEVTLAE